MSLVLPANEERPLSADRVPILTEVVELGTPLRHEGLPVLDTAIEPLVAAFAGPEAAPEPAAAALATRPAAVAAGASVEQLVGEVLATLAPRIESLLEARLRDALAPALARAADGLIRDSRQELAATLRELVEEVVDRALDDRRPGAAEKPTPGAGP